MAKNEEEFNLMDLITDEDRAECKAVAEAWRQREAEDEWHRKHDPNYEQWKKEQHDTLMARVAEHSMTAEEHAEWKRKWDAEQRRRLEEHIASVDWDAEIDAMFGFTSDDE